MKVSNIASRTVKTYTLSVEDGEIRPQPFTRTGRTYRVTHITVEKRDGNVASILLAGPVLKKDGTGGLNGATERLYGQHAWPEWLHGIVGGLA